MLPLRKDSETRARTLFVEFPEGWERHEAGSYASAEEFVVLQGALRISGARFEAGDWAYLPAGFLRTDMAADPSALVYARFAGPARWLPDEGDASAPTLHRKLEPAGARMGSPLGNGSAWPLKHGSADASWLIEPPVVHAPSPVDAEVFELERQRWFWVAKGEPLPEIDGRCFCRTFEVEHKPS